MICKIDDTIITFSMQGNCTDKNGNYYSIETLYKAWKDYIGKEIEWKDNKSRIISDVSIQGDFLFIDTIKK